MAGEIRPFGELFAEGTRNGLTRPKAVRGAGVKMVNMGELFAHPRLRNADMDRVPLSDSEARKFLLSEGDLLFARQSLVLEGAGKCSIFLSDDEPVTFESHVTRVRLDRSKADPRFYFYYFYYLQSHHGKSAIRSIVEQGAGASGIRGSDLQNLGVLWMPPPEQRAIARILGTLDDKIELNRRRNQTLEAMARALFKDWFVDFGPVRAKLEGREPYLPADLWQLFPDRLDDEGKPEGWVVGSVEELCSSITSGGTPARKKFIFWDGGTIPWFKTGELQDGPLLDSEEKITETALQESSCKLWPAGTILFALYASPTVGRLGVLTSPATSNQAAAGLIAKESIGVPFLRRALLEAREKLQNIAVGAAQQNINQAILKTHRLALPPACMCAHYSKLVRRWDDQQVQAQDREHLRTLLGRASGGVIFTTLQKFSPASDETEFPMLTDRSNIVVIADEAHRSQYGFKAKVASKTGEIAYGFAKYLRDALPNASFIGFTGTPIEATDVNTPAVFGHYIDIYDISRAVEDGATVPIYYESRLARIELDEDEKPRIDAEIEALLEDEDEPSAERTKQKWSTVEALVGSDKRLALVAADLVQHFEDRVAALDGKAMMVCMSRRICVALYDEIIKLRPDWHSPDDNAGRIKIVMTGAASDPPSFQQHIGNKARRDLLAKRARDARDPLQLVIVRDMWLTGFDAPSMHTLYIDKPMRGHGLMQAIARVNRVFRDKPAGLIVDYIGIAQNLKSALAQYSKPDQDKTGIDEREAVAVLLEKYEIVRDMFHGFDYRTALSGTPGERLAMMAGAIEWILDKQQQWAAAEKTREGKKQAQRRFADGVLALSKAFALASSSDEARGIREEVGFFQAIRTALVKTASGSGVTRQDRELAIQQIVSRAVVSTEIVDILAAAGIQTPDISILSDEFLLEVQQMEKKNLALEALRKLLNDSIRSRSRTNVVETRAFTERLEDAIARYHANAITTAEVLQELINLAQDIRAARNRGEEQGLSLDEIAFYDALAENESALQVMGDASLRVIAHELLVSLRENVAVDWAHRESARARLRVLVKRILRKYGYPPDLQDAAVQTVLQQAEALSSQWSLPLKGGS